jgi:hypothetical protein
MREQLCRKLTNELQRRLPRASKPQVKNLALLTQALVFSEDCHLPKLALQLPIAGQRDSLIQRLSRFLDNCRVDQRNHYLPLLADLFAHWPDREVNLVMDRTDIKNEVSILLLAVAFKHRVIPLTWRVLSFGGTSAALQTQLLQDVEPFLPSGKRIVFFGDSEFRAVGLQRYFRKRHWDWQVGVTSDTLFQHNGGDWQSLHTITVQRGQRRYLHRITLTKSEAFPDVHLMVDWTHNWDTPRYVVCDRPTNGRSWRCGRKRFWIEPTFRDWKSYGFDLETSQITDHQRLNRLVLGIAIATLWLIHLGHWAITTGRDRRLVAKHRPEDYSIFRLGRDYAQRCQIRPWKLPVCLHR